MIDLPYNYGVVSRFFKDFKEEGLKNTNSMLDFYKSKLGFIQKLSLTWHETYTEPLYSIWHSRCITFHLLVTLKHITLTCPILTVPCGLVPFCFVPYSIRFVVSAPGVLQIADSGHARSVSKVLVIMIEARHVLRFAVSLATLFHASQKHT